MNANNRYAEYLRAEERVMRASAEAIRLSPHYDDKEQRRAELIATYEDVADDYARMAAGHEQQGVA
jgi:hypothetical protein